MEKQSDNSKTNLYHGVDGKFKHGNPGGPGGARTLAGRPPKPEDSLLKKLYGILEESSELAITTLQKQLKSKDAKVAQGAAKIILSKILPERSANESWKIKDYVSPETMQNLKEMLELKRQKDLEEDKKKEKGAMEEEERRLQLVKGEGN